MTPSWRPATGCCSPARTRASSRPDFPGCRSGVGETAGREAHPRPLRGGSRRPGSGPGGGRLRWGCPSSTPPPESSASSHGAPVLGLAAADVDGDGAAELLILVEGELLRYDGGEASLVAGDLAGSWMPPSAADLDGDGRTDVVLADRGGQLRSLGQAQRRSAGLRRGAGRGARLFRGPGRRRPPRGAGARGRRGARLVRGGVAEPGVSGGAAHASGSPDPCAARWSPPT